MPRLKKAQKARKEAAKKAHTTRRANSRRWLLESFAPRSHHSTPGWDQTDRASPCVTKDNQHTLAPQPNSPESGTALAPAKQPTSQPPKTRGPCRQTIWRRKKREEARQASTCAKAEKTAAQKKSPDPTVQPESRAETRSVLESFAPHSCIDPVTYRQHKTYNPENTAPGSPQGDQDSSQSSQPTVSPGHSQRVSPNAGTERHTQELGSPPAAVHGPCRQTIWRRKKREKARNEPDTQTESESGVSPDNREGQNMDIGERKFTQAVQKWPRGSVVRDVDLKNKVLDAAINDMQQLLSSQRNCPEGQDHTRHEQVLMFMEVQKERPLETRVNLAMEVANKFQKRHRVQRRILEHEKTWVKERQIPEGNQGRVKNGHVLSVLQKDGTVKVAKGKFVEEKLEDCELFRGNGFGWL